MLLDPGPTRIAAAAAPEPDGRTPTLRLWSRVMVGVTVLAGAWAFAPFVLIALDAALHHRVFLGVAGFYPMDGLQYLAWVRDAEHGLIRNLYGSARDHAVFVHPLWTPSGLLQGVIPFSDAALLGFWKAVSAVVLLAGARRLAWTHISPYRPGRRVLALLLALFGGLTPVAGLMWLFDGGARWDFARAAGDLIPAVTLWDYAPLAIALGLMPFAIAGVERLLDGTASRLMVARTASAGLLVTWLHPWQGETLIAVYVGLVVWRRLDERAGAERSSVPYRALAAVITATALPALYYLLLSRVDPGWAVSERNSVSAATIPVPVLLCCVVPVILAAYAGVRRALADPRARALVLWTGATLLTVVISRSGEYRAIDGLAIPVAVLAVRGWPAGASGRRKWAWAASLAALAPAAAFTAMALPYMLTPAMRQYTELGRSDIRAVALAARAAGGSPIIAPAALGTAIPALTDEPSWAGHPIWTPDPAVRLGQSGQLLSDLLTRAQADQLLGSTRSRALVQPCGWPGNLKPELAPLGFRELTTGCARVYIRPRSRAAV